MPTLIGLDLITGMYRKDLVLLFIVKLWYPLTSFQWSTLYVYRSDYEDFLRELAKLFTQRLASRIDAYMASFIQVCIVRTITLSFA